MGLLEQNTENFSVIPIRKNALEKTKAYARLMGANECYGFLLSPIGKNDGIVYDSMLADDQEVSAGRAKISGVAAANAKEAIHEMGYKPIGFWHSHGNLGPFHSGTDDDNMESLLLSFAANTEEKIFTDELKGNVYIVQDNLIIVRHDGKEYVLKTRNSSFRVEQSTKQSELIFGLANNSEFFLNNGDLTMYLKEPANVEIREYKRGAKKISGIGYSLVVNNHGDYHAEIGTSVWCNSCERLETKVNKGELKVVLEDEIKFTDPELIADLEKKVRNYSLRKGGSLFEKLRSLG